MARMKKSWRFPLGTLPDDECFQGERLNFSEENIIFRENVPMSGRVKKQTAIYNMCV